MSDHPTETGAAGLGNLPEYTVSELSQAVKQTVEGRFERVRVRGEITGFKRAASGHLYLRLKDENAVLDAVCWRGVAGRLGIKPEDGMEVIASGRLTTYPGRSSYQIVIDSLELAGEGALLKLLEERRKKLLAEGLFAAERKRPLPYLPAVIGVVTSPTGAVIRDILHRLSDRFPRRVLVWPVQVQGESAAGQVAAAIRGFNELPPGGEPPRPDVLIVARGGGSLEDLWAFNEEVVVRAAAASEIPLISAVGHETDTTLIDFAADRRAPTPTAAAEIAVPVRSELLADLLDLERRLTAGTGRYLETRRDQVEGLGRGLPDPQRLLAEKTQRLDDRAERLGNAVAYLLERRRARIAELASRIPHPRQQIQFLKGTLEDRAGRLVALAPRLQRAYRQQLEMLDAGRRLPRAAREHLNAAEKALDTFRRLLESTSYHKVLARGFAVVRGPEGVITAAGRVAAGMALDIEFTGDQHVAAIAAGSGTSPRATASAKPRTKPARAGGRDDPQGTLL